MGKRVSATPTPEIMVGQGGANILENRCHTTPPLKGGRGWWGVHHLFGVGWGKSNQSRSINDNSTASLRRTSERCNPAWRGTVRSYTANLVPMPLILIGRETVGWTYAFALYVDLIDLSITRKSSGHSKCDDIGSVQMSFFRMLVEPLKNNVCKLTNRLTGSCAERSLTLWKVARESEKNFCYASDIADTECFFGLHVATARTVNVIPIFDPLSETGTWKEQQENRVAQHRGTSKPFKVPLPRPSCVSSGCGL